MPPKACKRKRAASDTTASQPLEERTADNAFLYNEDLYGLNPKLDFRTRLIISCFVTDSIEPTIVRQAWANARIFPPSAVQEIKKDVSVRDGGLARRASSRVVKDDAANEIRSLGLRAHLMSSGDVIVAAAAIVDNVLQADKYALRPMEELTGKKKKKTVAADSAPKPPAPPHKKVVGYFTPEASQLIADSLASEKESHDRTRLFVCKDFQNKFECNKRFASYVWVKKHLKKDHNIDLPELTQEQQQTNKTLMQQQKDFKATKAGVQHVQQTPTVEQLPSDNSDDLSLFLAEEHEFVCDVCNAWGTDRAKAFATDIYLPFISDDEPPAVTLWDHYILKHPERFWNSAISCRRTATGEVFSTEACDDYQDGADYDCCQIAHRMVEGGHIDGWNDLQLCWNFLKSTKSAFNNSGIQLEDDDMQYILDNRDTWKFVQPSPSTDTVSVSPSATTVPCSPSSATPSLTCSPCSPAATVQKRRRR
jgi:hypothetical protein